MRETLAAIDIDMDTPTSYRTQIQAVHNSVAGQFGVERSLAKLKRIGQEWPYKRIHVAKYIKECPCCQKMSYLKKPIHTHRFTTSTYDIMERIAIDTVGEFPVDEFGYKYVIVIIFCFSRFIELYPTMYFCLY